jgi:hypothetical protein
MCLPISRWVVDLFHSLAASLLATRAPTGQRLNAQDRRWFFSTLTCHRHFRFTRVKSPLERQTQFIRSPSRQIIGTAMERSHITSSWCDMTFMRVYPRISSHRNRSIMASTAILNRRLLVSCRSNVPSVQDGQYPLRIDYGRERAWTTIRNFGEAWNPDGTYHQASSQNSEIFLLF